MRIWVVITQDGERLTWFETYRNRLLRRFPQIKKDGFVWLDGYPYVPNPERIVHEYYPNNEQSKTAFIGGLMLSVFLYTVAGLSGIIGGMVLAIIASLMLRTIRKEDQLQYWRQNEPDAINLRDEALTPTSVGITGKTIAQYSKSEHLRRLVQPDTNWFLIGVLCILVGVMAGAIGYSVALSGVGK